MVINLKKWCGVFIDTIIVYICNTPPMMNLIQVRVHTNQKKISQKEIHGTWKNRSTSSCIKHINKYYKMWISHWPDFKMSWDVTCRGCWIKRSKSTYTWKNDQAFCWQIEHYKEPKNYTSAKIWNIIFWD